MSDRADRVNEASKLEKSIWCKSHNCIPFTEKTKQNKTNQTFALLSTKKINSEQKKELTREA